MPTHGPPPEPPAEERPAPSFRDHAANFADIKDHPSVQVDEVDSSMSKALPGLARAFHRSGGGRPVITEGTRQFRPGTATPDRNMHSVGFGFDVRVNHLSPSRQRAVYSEVLKEMPDGYQAVLHGKGRNIHIHIERDDDHSREALNARRRKLDGRGT